LPTVGQESLGHVHIRRSLVRRVREALVGIAAVGDPLVSGHKGTDTSELTNHGVLGGRWNRVSWVRVRMDIVDIANVEPIDWATAVGVDKAVRIIGLHPLNYLSDIWEDTNAVTLIEHFPLDNARMVAAAIHGGLGIVQKDRDGGSSGTAVLLDKIVHNHNADGVGVVVPALRVDLLVETERVEAKGSSQGQVTAECIIGWGSVLTIWPPRLIEHARKIGKLAIDTGTTTGPTRAAHITGNTALVGTPRSRAGLEPALRLGRVATAAWDTIGPSEATSGLVAGSPAEVVVRLWEGKRGTWHVTTRIVPSGAWARGRHGRSRIRKEDTLRIPTYDVAVSRFPVEGSITVMLRSYKLGWRGPQSFAFAIGITISV